jgi:hypothetical protein
MFRILNETNVYNNNKKKIERYSQNKNKNRFNYTHGRKIAKGNKQVQIENVINYKCHRSGA